jgi:uroporphyrinogen-III synthase
MDRLFPHNFRETVMKTTLYLGSDPSSIKRAGRVIHYPVIKIVPRPAFSQKIKSALGEIASYTHLIFTSKHAVQIFFAHLKTLQLDGIELASKCVIAIGDSTARVLTEYGVKVACIAKEKTQEGIISELSLLDLDQAYVLLPRSSLARDALLHFLQEHAVRHQVCDLYDTLPHIPEKRIDLNEVDEVVFTSPSTVKAFFEIFPSLPQKITITAIGPVTAEALLARQEGK